MRYAELSVSFFLVAEIASLGAAYGADERQPTTSPREPCTYVRIPVTGVVGKDFTAEHMSAWLLDRFSGLRVGPYKMYSVATEKDYRDTVNSGGFSGHTVEYTYGKLFHLFLDPKEEHSFAVRKLVTLPIMSAISAQHQKTFEKYPPRIQVKGADSG